MKFGRHLILAVVLALTASAACLGQAAPASGSRVQSSGFSFVVPTGWRSKQDQGWALASPDGSTVIVVTTHNYDNFESAVRDTRLTDGFEVAGKAQDLKGGGKTLRVTKRTPSGIGVIDIFVLFSPNGGGVLVTALSDSRLSESAFNAGLGISDSVVFAARSEGTAASGSSEWNDRLTGKHLLYLYSGNGYFEEKHIYLCRSGTFYQTTGSGGFTPNDADGGSFAARGGKRGRWSISGSILLLQFQDGSAGQYNLTKRPAGNEVGMNGKRYFVQANPDCT